jgi:hypothetical protein
MSKEPDHVVSLRNDLTQKQDWELEMIISSKAEWSLDHQLSKDILKKRQEKAREKHSTKNWYQKPVGIVFLTVVAGVITTYIIAKFPEYFR